MKTTSKEKIVDLLRSTKREGMDALIAWMEIHGFFTSPCSGAYHLCQEGGLAEHSLNVYKQMFVLAKAWNCKILDESIIICSLLHDLGKVGDYGKPNYVQNILKDGKQSEAKPYTTNKQLLYVPHEMKSVEIANRFISMTEDETFAIYCHNGLYGDMRNVVKGNETELYMLLHFADMWASRVIEKEGK